MHGRSYRTRGHPLLDSPLQDKTEAAELREHQSWLDAGRDANKAKVAKQLRKRTRIDLDGKVLFLASSDFEPELKDRVAASGLRVVSEHLLANIFVVSNPNEPGQRVQWACSLQGGTIAVPAYVASCGLKGAAIEYTSATHTIRKIWISPQFVLQHPIISVIALGAIRAPSSKWRTFPSQTTFVAAMVNELGRPKRNQRLYHNIALVTAVEKNLEALGLRVPN
jgi:hypothetical protein